MGSKLFKETFSEEAIFFGMKTTSSMEKRARYQFFGHIPIIFRYIVAFLTIAFLGKRKVRMYLYMSYRSVLKERF